MHEINYQTICSRRLFFRINRRRFFLIRSSGADVIILVTYARCLLADTLPPEALRILRNSLRSSGNAALILEALDDLEGKLKRYTREFQSRSGDWMPAFPFDIANRSGEFDSTLREFLIAIGSRVDLTNFSPRPLTEAHFHGDLAGRCRKAGIELSHEYCDGVKIDRWGRARADRYHVLRLKKNEIVLDVEDNGDGTAHIIRFLAVCPQTSAITKMRTFSKMVSLLHQTMPVIHGRAATGDDNAVRLQNGEWRFLQETSPWGFSISRLEHFWFAAGAVTARLIGNCDPLLFLYREDEAIAFHQRFRQKTPAGASPSPYALASRWGIFGKEALSRLKEDIQ
ncbi:MAG: hypothetical protein WCO94_08635 [Verrucomicrobiota bacterium]